MIAEKHKVFFSLPRSLLILIYLKEARVGPLVESRRLRRPQVSRVLDASLCAGLASLGLV